MSEENEIIKCSSCKTKYYEHEYEKNRFGVRYKSCNRCRNKHKCIYEGCDYATAHKGHLTRHIKSIHDRIKDCECPDCDYVCSQKTNLSHHIKSVHDKIKDIQCPECDYVCSWKGDLNKHIKAIHAKIKDIQCKECDYKCSMNSNLSQHIKAIHDKIKDNQCPECDYVCSRKVDLNTHIQTCTGESNLSHGEHTIAQYLQRNNIEFINQGTHNALRSYEDKGYLFFDFILPMDKYGFYCFIEYDGRQHFEPQRFGGISQERAEENFKRQQHNDRLKDEYCDNNCFPLLRIKYDCVKTEDIEQKVEEFLKPYLPITKR